MRCDHLKIARDGYTYEQCTREATHQVTYSNASGLGLEPERVCQWHAPWKLAARQPTYCQIEPIEIPQNQE